jgi:hypothetical protein
VYNSSSGRIRPNNFGIDFANEVQRNHDANINETEFKNYTMDEFFNDEVSNINIRSQQKWFSEEDETDTVGSSKNNDGGVQVFVQLLGQKDQHHLS